MKVPVRIQRKRTKGWKAPEGAVNCTRPGKWGNPFAIGEWYKMGTGGNGFMYLHCLVETPDNLVGFTKIENAAMAADWFRRFRSIYPARDIGELRGKDLMCWCPLDQPCHADVLLELANATEVQP